MATPHQWEKIEALVCDFLTDHGLQLLTRNYRCRLGEIDAVLLQSQPTKCIVFVEVRYRTDDKHGAASETVDHRKQSRLKRAALHFLQKHCSAHQTARIDVVAVSPLNQSADQRGDQRAPGHALAGINEVYAFQNYSLHWIQNAIES